MSNWAQIPTEILVQILNCATENDRHSWKINIQYMLVCKSWSTATRRIYYDEVVLNTVTIFDRFIESMVTYPGTQIVNTVLVGKSVNKEHFERNLGQLLATCTNLTHIKAECQNGSFFAKMLLEFYTTGNGLHLKTIPECSLQSDGDIRTYGYTAYALRHTLEEITLVDSPLEHPTFALDETVKRLQEFQKLRTINLHIRGGENIYKIGMVIQNHPSLTSICIKRSENMINLDNDPEAVGPFSMKAILGISKLVIEPMTTITGKLMKYIMHSCPELDQLQLNRHGMLFSDDDVQMLRRIEEQGLKVSAELWLRFLEYIDKMKIFSVKNLFIKELLEVLDIISKSTNLCKNVEITYLLYATPITGLQPYVNVNSAKNYNINVQSKYDRRLYERRTEMVFDSRIYNYSLPHESLIETIGFGVNALQIEIYSAEEYGIPSSRAYKMANGNLFDHIFEHCTCLDTLWVTKGEFAQITSNMRPTKSLECLQFDECSFGYDFLSELSTRLPSRMEFLIFLDCKFSSLIGKSVGVFYTIDMPYTTIGCLYWRTIMVTGFDFRSNATYIKITKKYETLYFRLNGNDLTISSVEEFIESTLRHDDSISLYIRCHEIEKLIINVSDTDILIKPKAETTFCKARSYVESRWEFHNFASY